MPAVKAMGPIDCEIMQTGLDSNILIATYADKAAADTAAKKRRHLEQKAEKNLRPGS